MLYTSTADRAWLVQRLNGAATAAERAEKLAAKGAHLVNVDATVIKDGYHGDTSRMYCVGRPSVNAASFSPRLTRPMLVRKVSLNERPASARNSGSERPRDANVEFVTKYSLPRKRPWARAQRLVGVFHAQLELTGVSIEPAVGTPE